MRYSEAKNLAPKEFKRLSGVYPETFAKMGEIVKEHQKNKKVSGRPSKLSLEKSGCGVFFIGHWPLAIGHCPYTPHPSTQVKRKTIH